MHVSARLDLEAGGRAGLLAGARLGHRADGSVAARAVVVEVEERAARVVPVSRSAGADDRLVVHRVADGSGLAGDDRGADDGEQARTGVLDRVGRVAADAGASGGLSLGCLARAVRGVDGGGGEGLGRHGVSLVVFVLADRSNIRHRSAVVQGWKQRLQDSFRA